MDASAANSDRKVCPRCGGPVSRHSPKGLCRRCIARVTLPEPEPSRAANTDLRVRCPQCGHAIELVEGTGLSDIRCDSCGTRFNIVDDRAAGETAASLSRVGQFEILGKLGTGAFGTVWKARDTRLDRLVALKIPRQRLLEPAEIEKFLREARATAQLRHPNIVSVFEVGREAELIYIVCDFVDGVSLAESLAGRRVSPREAARLCRKIASALEHAHQQGVIHRDIKPGNILLDAKGEPHLTDFGLARRDTGEATMTLDGQLLGTPAYMSPELARGQAHQADARTDTYSLGVVLYQLLTGELPFRGSTRMLIHQVIHDDPPSPRRLNAHVPRDLETICLKCLEKEPGRRYDSSRELGEELDRFLSNEPIRARPIGPIGKGWRWCRRKPVLAAMAGTIATLLLTVTVVSTVAALRIAAARRMEERERQRAEAGEKDAQRLLYAASLNLAQREWEQPNVARVRQLLEETEGHADLGFEWYFWQRQTHLEARTFRGHLEGVNSVAFSPDGQRMVTGSGDRTAKVWEATGGREPLTLNGHSGPVWGASFSPGGRRVATASEDRTARVWDADSGKELLTLKGHKAGVLSVAFSPDDQRIVTGSGDGTAKVWDADSGSERLTLEGHSARIWAVAFSPDGQRIVTGSADATAKVWEAASGKELLTLKGHSAWILSVAFSPEAHRIITGSQDGTAKVWEAASGKEVITLEGHRLTVWSAAFSPDGQRIVTGSADETAKVWEAASGKELLTLKGHTTAVRSVALSLDGRWIATGSDDQTAKLWDATGVRGPLALKGHSDRLTAVAFSPDGQRIATGSWDQTARVWEAASGKELVTLKGHGDRVTSVAFSPDGQRIVTGSDDQMAKIWEATAGKELLTLRGHGDWILAVAVSPNGQRVVTGSSDQTAKVWDPATGEERLTLRGHSDRVTSVAFSPDGQRIVTGSDDQTARVWDAPSGKELVTLKGRGGEISSVAFAPDGQRIVTGSGDGTGTVWEAATGRELIALKGHSARIWSVVFSPDAKRIVTVSGDGTAKVWDTLSGKELLTLKGHSAAIRSVALSPDGRLIVTGSGDRTARVWQAATAGQVAAWQTEEDVAADRLAVPRRARATASERERALRTQDPAAIKQWLVLAPIPLAGRDGTAALGQQQILQESQLRARAGERVKVAESERVWRALRLEDYVIDFNQLSGEVTEWSAAYAVCYIQSEARQSGLLMKVGSDDQAKIYLNGKEIYRSGEPRSYWPDQDVVTGVELEAGLNVLVFKVVNEASYWQGSVRFTDAGDQPVKGIRVTLAPP